MQTETMVGIPWVFPAPHAGRFVARRGQFSYIREIARTQEKKSPLIDAGLKME